MEKQKPNKTFRAGSVRASVWDNELVSSTGEKVNRPRVSIERRYKNEHGEWVSSNHYSVNELPRVQAVVQAAFNYLVLTDRENGEHSTTRPGSLSDFG